jgi:hypothetical protein
MLVAPVPEELQIDHLCKVRNCCNPRHLEPVTPRENTHRSSSAPGVNAKKTHCKRGHEFTPENTLQFNGRHGIERQCRICHNARGRKYRATNPEAQVLKNEKKRAKRAIARCIVSHPAESEEG